MCFFSSVPVTHRGSPALNARSLLITGGTGTFGHAFTRYALDHGASRVVILSRSEAKQAQMRRTFHDDPRLRFFVGDVRDAHRMLDAMRDVDVVIHAAALKRVETCEAEPNEAIATNIIGTQNVARACIERGVPRAVFLSTDKAAAPCTLYGATKLTAERLWVQSNVYAAGTRTRFSATRYGNVLGSTGSVVELWRHQVAAGEPITVTEPDMTRFWMRIADAVQLVVTALTEMCGGEVFVPKLKASGILLLASAVGGPDLQVRFMGLRRGEKMHETLISVDEAKYVRDYGAHFRIMPDVTWGTRSDSSPVMVPAWQAVGDTFVYSSDVVQQFTLDELRELIT